MKQNLGIKPLPEAAFKIVDTLSESTGPIRFLNPSPHLAFDIFDEENDQPLISKAPWDD